MFATCLGFRALPTLGPGIVQSKQGYRPCIYHHDAHSVQVSRRFTILASQQQGQEESSNMSTSEATSSTPISSISADELEQKLGKRRRARKDKPSKATAEVKPTPKDWETMNLAEKAWELYIGEKGALFWLNKLAYAAIFVIIGGWICFRFVGPALNLYQLDSPLLPPDQVLGGSK